jgi:RNA polymerase sigma factor (sigma-70 family)
MNDLVPEELLAQYLAAASEEEADRLLARLLEEVATPVVRRVVASAVRDAAEFGDAEDITADTILDLLRRFRDLRGEHGAPIQDLRRYIVTCAYNRCHERLRDRHPARTRLRNQLRYLCEHDSDLALWRNGHGELVCGAREWIGREPANGIAADEIRLAATSDPAAENRAQVGILVHELFAALRAPLSLSVLTSAIARLIGVELQRIDQPLTDFEYAPGPSPAESLETRMTLRQLWNDVRKLAWKQRVALLLNLRDVQGRECLTLLPLTRTATIPEIAAVVGMPAEKFAALWSTLPMTDAAIAELLDITPRQVIKLRRLARERLRRMAKHHDDRNLGTEIDSSQSGITLVTRR